MRDLTEEGRRIVEALVRAPVAWQSPRELSRAVGRDLDETTDLLATLDADGWLAAWEREPDVVVTLSVAGASCLGLRLVESGHDEVPRWARRGDPEPPGLRASGVFRDERAAALERLADPCRTPEDAVERAEEAFARCSMPTDLAVKAVVDGLPDPTILLGLGLIPWPGPGDGRKASCPSCGSRRLKPSMYCLYCDRWGLDHLLRDETATTPRPVAEPRDDARRREFERQARKARRKARLLAQSQAERAAKTRRKRA